MEITQQQFETNFETLQDEEKAMVAGLIENNEPTTLQAFAKVLGITFDLPEPEPMPEPSEEISEPEQEIPQTDEMSPITRELMALGDQPTEPVGITGPIQKEGADNSGVADDVLMDAEQKSFIVNAAALKLFGYGDFVNRILKPNIKSLKERTGQVIELATITQPQQQVQGDTPIAASNRELYIPPLLAEEIGYELLEKINNRGKPETEKKLEEQKQKEQPQEPQAAMQAALGKRIQMNEGDKIPTPKRKPLEVYLADYIAEREGLIKEADIPTKDDKLTIGYGHTENVREGQTITKEEARKLLNKDVKKRIPEIKRAIPIFETLPLSIQAPLMSEWFRGSLVQSPEARRLLNEGLYDQAATEYLNNEEYKNAAKRKRSGIRKRMEEASEAIRNIKNVTETPEEEPILTNNSPEEGRELLKERPRGMRYGLDKVQPVMDKREITQFPERVLQ